MWAVLNFLVVSISRSLFHPLISKSVLVLGVEGKKTRKKYYIPVSYYEHPEGPIVCVTDRPNLWWKNRSVPRRVLPDIQAAQGHKGAVQPPRWRDPDLQACSTRCVPPSPSMQMLFKNRNGAFYGRVGVESHMPAATN